MELVDLKRCFDILIKKTKVLFCKVDNEFIKLNIPTWTKLAGLGRSKIVSATMFMPVIGYFLFFNIQIVELISLSAELLGLDSEMAKNQSFNSLRTLYLGLALLAVASVTFKIFCPTSIKDSGNLSTYINTFLPLMDENLHQKLKNEVKSSGPCEEVGHDWIESVVAHEASLEDEFSRSNPQNLSQFIPKTLSYDQWMNRNKVQFNSLLMARFHQDDYSRLRPRFFAALFYVIGFLLVLWPSVKIFFLVFSATITG